MSSRALIGGSCVAGLLGVLGLLCGPAAHLSAQEPEPTRLLLVIGSEVAPNMAAEVSDEVVERLGASEGFEVLGWEAAFERAMVELGRPSDDRPEPNCITGLQLARAAASTSCCAE